MLKAPVATASGAFYVLSGLFGANNVIFLTFLAPKS